MCIMTEGSEERIFSNTIILRRILYHLPPADIKTATLVSRNVTKVMYLTRYYYFHYLDNGGKNWSFQCFGTGQISP